MRHIVEELLRVEGVVGSFLVGRDGLIVANTLLDEEDVEVIGALTAALFREIDKAMRRFGVGTLMDSIIDAKNGSVLLLCVHDVILVVITERITNMGLIKMEMRRAAKRLSEEVPVELF
jgi:uncharacterized protein